MTGAEALPATSEAAPRRATLRARIAAIGRLPRIMGLDLARGLAVIGMMAAHMANPPEIEWGQPSTWAGIVHGRAAILFALLAGVSTAIITGRSHRPAREEMPRLRALLVRRGIVIFAIGLALEALNTNIAVILCVYGVLFLCAIPFLRWRVRSLIIGAAALAVIGPFFLATLNVLLFSPIGPGLNLAVFGVYPVPVWLALMLAGLAIGRTEFTQTRVAAGLVLIGLGLAVIGYVAGAAVTAQLDGAADYSSTGIAGDSATGAPGDSATGAPGDSATGAADADKAGGAGDLITIPGSQLSQADTSGMTCQAQPGQWISCWSQSTLDASTAPPGNDTYWSRLAAADPVTTGLTEALAVSEHSGGLFEIVGSGGFAIAVLGLCLVIARRLRWVLLPVACLGMMPLTTYSVHIVIYWLLAGGPQGVYAPSVAAWVWTTIGLLAAATTWTALWGRGPLERFLAAQARRSARGRGKIRGITNTEATDPDVTNPDAAQLGVTHRGVPSSDVTNRAGTPSAQ